MTTLVQDAPVRNRFAAASAAWRSILVHVQPDADAQPRLAVAADLARKLDATLIGVGAEMLPPTSATDPYGLLGGEFVTALLEVMQTNLSRAGAAFKTATQGLATEWKPIQDLPVMAMDRLARSADLIVAGGSPLKERDSYRWCDPAELALKAGRPVLVAPPNGGVLAAQAVVVAWKDTREARRAVADSLPILRGAERVVVMETCEADNVEAIETHHAALRAYFGRHGVVAESRVVLAKPLETAWALQAEAGRIGADLIVAGAYGHSRLGEWAFGGVTADLLADPQRFLLFSH
jgi:nucleotide-binding universal stress UspA family protein